MVVGDLATSVDVVILGGGPGGYVAAIRAAQLGKQVVLISEGPVGGTCLHKGCIPAKALLTAADRAWQIQQSAGMGIEAGQVRLDFAAMQNWKQSLVDKLAQGVNKLLKHYRVKVVRGRGWFINDGEVRVEGPHGTLRYIFESAIIAVGAEAAPLPALPFDGCRIVTPAQLLASPGLPTKLSLIGSDYITAELATIFSKLGVSIRLLIPAGETLLGTFEPTAGRQVQARLKKLGMTIENGLSQPETVSQPNETVAVSVGLTPRTSALHLSAAGVMTDAAGFVPVNERLQTNVPHIYAVGDVTGGLPLATFAIKQAQVAAESLAGQAVVYAPQALPQVAWTDPEIAAVGLTSRQAEALGYRVVTHRQPMAANGRAHTLGKITGAVILVAEAEREILLGVTIIGPQASELISTAALALEMGATLTDLAETLLPHPTLSETLAEAALAALGRPVHSW